MSDVARLRYVFPKFHHGYNAMMKTLTSSLKYEASDPTQFRLKVLAYGKRHGVSAAIEAYGISRRSYHYWLATLKKNKGKLVSLVPKSTRPHKTRRMEVDERLLEFIRSIREKYGRIGKRKLKVLLDAYTASLGISSYGTSKIGKIIKRHNYFYDFTLLKNKHAFARTRVRRVGKDVRPGYLEIDSIILYIGNRRLRFVTIMDIVTKVAYAERVRGGRAKEAKRVLAAFQTTYPIKVHTIQTDNGSEFLRDFHTYLEEHKIIHLFTYPHSPKVNGVIERFNRTIQEEFIERCDAWWLDMERGDEQLRHYLTWYNTKRPHAALRYVAPLTYAQQYM